MSASGGKCMWRIISCWRTHLCVQSFGRGFEFLIQIIWNSYSGLETIPVLLVGVVRKSTTIGPLQYSCWYLDRCIILDEDGPLMTQRSKPRYPKRFIAPFFHAFIDFGSTSLYSWFFLTPLHLPEALSNMQEYEVAGFPGCIGLTDCTHITTER